jgi:5-methylcytosine-specific restriction endonuclease McrA
MEKCIFCNKEFNKLFSPKHSSCQNCYDKNRKKRYAENGYRIDCGQCKKSVPKNYINSTKGTICHTCYEKNRRRRVIKEAQKDPIKLKILKDKYHSNYIKSKIKGSYKTVSRRLRSALRRYRKHDPETDLTFQWYYDNIIDKNCYYCNVTDIIAKKVTDQYLHVDKLVPEKGYKTYNCVPACKACNTAKLDLWTPEETKELGKLISKFFKKRVQG